MRRAHLSRILALAAAVAAAQPLAAAEYGATYRTLDPWARSLSITEGKTITVRMKLENTGTLPWTTDVYHLSYHWKGSETVFEGERTFLKVTVPASMGLTLENVTLKAPSKAGTYTLAWDMVREGVTWFSNAGVPPFVETVRVTPDLSSMKPGPDHSLPAPAIDPCANPDLQVLLGAVTPGAKVLIGGCGFGSKAGSVQLSLKKTWTLTVLEWGTNGKYVFVQVPDTITGEPDQPGATLVVSRGSGSPRGSAPVAFTAARDLAVLKGGDVSVGCSTASDWDVCCNSAEHTSWNTIAPPVGLSCDGVTSYGDHGTNWAHTSGDSGTDTVSATLVNGWTFDSVVISKATGGNGGDIGDPVGLTPGATSATVSVSWSTHRSGSVGYDLWIYVTGPRGLPYK